MGMEARFGGLHARSDYGGDGGGDGLKERMDGNLCWTKGKRGEGDLEIAMLGPIDEKLTSFCIALLCFD
jgi:hypothetical protein